MTKYLMTAVLLLACVTISFSRRRPYSPDLISQPSIALEEVDLEPAASGHYGHGRVQIKVYRGPNDGHEHFAPHGYWVKQPADDERHH